MPDQGNLGVAKVRVGGREYPLVSQRNCKVCCSPYRHRVEEQSVAGRTWRAIAADLPEDAGLSPRNVSDHWRNEHLPVVAEATQVLAQEQAAERGDVVAVGAVRAAEYIGFARALVGRVNQRLVTGDVEPTIRDGISAAQLLATHGPHTSIDDSFFAEALSIVYQTVRDIMTSDQYEDFTRRLDGNERLQEVAALWESANHPGRDR